MNISNFELECIATEDFEHYQPDEQERYGWLLDDVIHLVMRQFPLVTEESAIDFVIKLTEKYHYSLIQILMLLDKVVAYKVRLFEFIPLDEPYYGNEPIIRGG